MYRTTISCQPVPCPQPRPAGRALPALPEAVRREQGVGQERLQPPADRLDGPGHQETEDGPGRGGHGGLPGIANIWSLRN